MSQIGLLITAVLIVLKMIEKTKMSWKKVFLPFGIGILIDLVILICVLAGLGGLATIGV